jgi:Na+/H+ antiporter NhaD/arsenite permease-like protein
MIIFVPLFKTITHLPPYIGMMISLAVVATFGEIFSRRQLKLTEYDASEKNVLGEPSSPLHKGLSRIEMPSILFFLGILMAVAAMESVGILFEFAGNLNQTMPMLGTEPAGETTSDLVIILLGILSAVIDNVPLVAASIGMFSNPMDDPMWHFIAFTTGTGGSMLIIGSAAGVVAMGLEKIDFFWYLKKIAPLALLGYFGGIVAFILVRMIII